MAFYDNSETIELSTFNISVNSDVQEPTLSKGLDVRISSIPQTCAFEKIQ